jgi:hypothetical protein
MNIILTIVLMLYYFQIEALIITELAHEQQIKKVRIKPTHIKHEENNIIKVNCFHR